MAYKGKRVREGSTGSRGNPALSVLGDFLDQTAAKAIKEWKAQRDLRVERAIRALSVRGEQQAQGVRMEGEYHVQSPEPNQQTEFNVKEPS